MENGKPVSRPARTDHSTNENTSAEASLPAGPAAVPVRNIPMMIVAVAATLYLLHWAAPVLIPVMLGVLISYALSPLVNALEKVHLHRAMGSALVMAMLIGGTTWLAYSLRDEALSVLETLPQAAQKLRYKLHTEKGAGARAVENVQKAATELEKAASESPANAPAAPRGVTRVQVEKPKLDVQALIWNSTVRTLTFLGQFVTVLFLAFFLMAAGNKFRRKVVILSGTRLSEKRVTIEVLDEITHQIQRYLLVQVFTSVLVGVASWLAFAYIGLENAAVWGIAAGVLNSVPYFGPVIVSGGLALVAFIQFGTFSMALMASSVALLITSIEGFALTPWLVGRTARINAVVVFVSVIAGGWLWGGWGLLLSVPAVMIVKAICDRVEDFKPVGELLGE